MTMTGPRSLIGEARLAAAVLLLAVATANTDLLAQSKALRPIRVAEKRALLIGNADYTQTRPLKNTLADVRELESALSELGFRTIRKENLTVDQMDDALNEFVAQLRADDMALFYFSGHGVQVDAANYLLPIDFAKGGSIRRGAMDAESVRSAMERKARVRVLVLDACRNNPFGEGKGDVIGLAKMSAKAEGTLVAYATAANKLASDNPRGRLGLYMTHFADELRRETVELGTVFDRTQQRVYAASGKAQLPEISDNVIGKLYLRGTPSASQAPDPAVPAVQVATPPAETAAEAWERLEGTDSEADLKRFITTYSGQKGGASTWLALAEERLRALPSIFAEREAQRLEGEWRAALEAITRTGSSAAGSAFSRDYGKAPGALVALADAYRTGQGLEESLEEATRLYRLAADQGDVIAMTQLGRLAVNGGEAGQDDGAAVGWYRRAADHGHAPAQALLGLAYERGLGVEQSFDAAVEWYRRAADQGDPDGKAYLGWAYATGRGVELDLNDALELCQEAADSGSPQGQVFLGRMHENGYGVDRDHAVAAELYRSAAARGSAEGQVSLGRLYEDGRGVELDYQDALELYRSAAARGSAEGQVSLGRMYEDGRGVERDYETALEWYGSAAGQGNAEGQYRLGTMLYAGKGTVQRYDAAIARYLEAADQGHAAARISLGDIYWDGAGAKKDRRKAKGWYQEALAAYREAAEMGDVEAQKKLGWMYDNGSGVKKDPRSATSWYRKAADQGYPDAQSLMGQRYFEGTGVRKNRTEAVRWYRLAADQGHADAQFRLGQSFQSGEGVKKDRGEAANWYRAAAQLGHSSARQALRKMGESE